MFQAKLAVRVGLFGMLALLGAGGSRRVSGQVLAPSTPTPAPAPAVANAQQQFPEPGPPADPDALGRGVQRTMTLLATSTPTHHNTVRILFYGQSITEQDWTKQVTQNLRERFPYADLQVENKAIGGFASQWLKRPAEHDLYPFYPDLMIFHVYGADNDYEEIIRNTRTRTTSEVLMQRDHATFWPLGTPEATTYNTPSDGGTRWDQHMNEEFLPETAKKYGCGLVDVRGAWLDYLRATHLQPRELTIDGTHLNAQGNFLMAQVIDRYLVYRPDLPKSDWAGLTHTYLVGHDVKAEHGKIVLKFTGNRIDLLPKPKPFQEWRRKPATGAGPGDDVEIMSEDNSPANSASIYIDGKAPSTYNLYYFSRPQPGPWSLLTVRRVDHNAPLVAEDWTLTILTANSDSTQWTYEVKGSVTGDDGAGSNAALFVSKSGRVQIDPSDFFRPGPSFHPDPVTPGYTITWKALPLFLDDYTPPDVVDMTHDQATVVAQGLANTQHTLTIIADGHGEPPIRTIRTYTPPVQ